VAQQPTTEDHLTLGEIIRRQRELAELPMRQLAAMAGISGPYLSQIERGLRDPSAEVLDALADSLQISAALLREPETDSEETHHTVQAIQGDPGLTVSQRRSLTEAYTAMRQVTLSRRRTRGRRTGRSQTQHVDEEDAG
jgi:transcriptional regulator with XRE-family HTH domain